MNIPKHNHITQFSNGVFYYKGKRYTPDQAILEGLNPQTFVNECNNAVHHNQMALENSLNKLESAKAFMFACQKLEVDFQETGHKKVVLIQIDGDGNKTTKEMELKNAVKFAKENISEGWFFDDDKLQEHWASTYEDKGFQIIDEEAYAQTIAVL